MNSQPTVIQPANREDGKLVGEYIGAAFAQDALSLWSIGKPSAVAFVYQLLAERLYVPAGQSTIVRGSGGALWLPPRKSKTVPLGATLAMVKHLFSSGGFRQLLRAVRVDQALQIRRPKTAHYYLFAIGVLPEARGRGIGEKLLRHTLTIADQENTPAYLENTNPRNTPLYERVGFRARDAFEPIPGCPPIVPMWRDPVAV